MCGQWFWSAFAIISVAGVGVWEHVCDGWSPLLCVRECSAHVNMSVRPASGPEQAVPAAPSEWGCVGCAVPSALPPGVVNGSGRQRGQPCSGPEQSACSLSCPCRGVECARWEVMADLCSLVLSFQWCADRWSLACFYSLCFSLSFFIPSSSSSHSAIKQNKLSSLRSARRLVLFTSYPSTVQHIRWDFSSRERRAVPRRGGGPADWLLSRHSHTVPAEIRLLFAVTLVMALILCLHAFVAWDLKCT